MTSFWTPPLLRISRGDATRWNKLLTFSGEPIRIEGSGSQLTFSPSAAPTMNALVAEIQLPGLNDPLLASFIEFPFGEICGAELSVEELVALPSGLCEALHEGMIAHVLGLLFPQERVQWALARTCRLRESPGDRQWFDAVCAGEDGSTVRLKLGAAICDWMRLAVAAPLQPSHLFARSLSQGVNAPVDFTIGFITITYRELRSLGPGTIVVMARQEPDTCLVRVEDSICTFVYTEEGWCCTRLEFVSATVSGGAGYPTEGNMADKAESDDPPLQGLRVTLVFEIGRRTIPLSELANWREGALVELDPPAAEAGMEVTIRSNGDVVGTGDLVMIDDRCAVRITRLIL